MIRVPKYFKTGLFNIDVLTLRIHFTKLPLMQWNIVLCLVWIVYNQAFSTSRSQSLFNRLENRQDGDIRRGKIRCAKPLVSILTFSAFFSCCVFFFLFKWSYFGQLILYNDGQIAFLNPWMEFFHFTKIYTMCVYNQLIHSDL